MSPPTFHPSDICPPGQTTLGQSVMSPPRISTEIAWPQDPENGLTGFSEERQL